VVVAHRPALVRRAYRILVVKDREIKEVSPVEIDERPGTWVTLLTGDMGNTFLALFSSGAVVARVGLWATRLRCPQVHRLCLLIVAFAGGRHHE
jgi:hypothetical protein